MEDEKKTRNQLLSELADLRQRIYGLDQAAEEKKRAEEALRDSEEKYKALFERSLYCVFVHDFEGRFVDANDTALNLLGYTREEISSLNFASLLNDEKQLRDAFQKVAEIMQTGSPKV